jgi:hypothetical protein
MVPFYDSNIVKNNVSSIDLVIQKTKKRTISEMSLFFYSALRLKISNQPR